MKKKTKGKHHGQISIDEFNVSDDDTLNYSLYCYALNRYKEVTGDKEAHLRDVVIYLEKEIRYYRKKIMSYDELRKKSAEKTKYKLDVADDIMGEWVSVDERLPDDYEEVLIWYTYCRYGDDFDDDYTTCAIGYYVHRYKEWFGRDPLGSYPRIKYWMPLPKAPESEVKS